MQDCAVTIDNQKGFECASIRCSFVYARDAEGRHKSGLLPGSLDGEHRHARQLQQAHGKGRSQQPAEQQPTATSTAATLAFLAPFEGARDGRRLFGRELALQEACGEVKHATLKRSHPRRHKPAAQVQHEVRGPHPSGVNATPCVRALPRETNRSSVGTVHLT